MKYDQIQVCVLFGVIWNVCGFDDRKLWLPNTNFDNPSNWNLHRVPCENDRAIFPSGMDLGVSLSEEGEMTVLRELVLARSGELFLPNDGTLSISGIISESSSCQGEDITFKRQSAESWLKPANWLSILKNPQALPHTDLIPCEHDTVEFTNDDSFRIQLPETDMTIGKIKFGDQQMSNVEWRSWLNSEAGYRQFIGRESDEDRSNSIIVQPSNLAECDDKASCVCNSDDNRRILKRVCGNVKCDANLPCYSPVTPYGHCCPMCGSYLLLKFDHAFYMSTFNEFIAGYLKMDEYSKVLVHARKTAYYDRSIQVVLVDKDHYDGSSAKLATKLSEDVLKDMDLGITKVSVYLAGNAILGSKLAHAARTIFGTLFGVLFFFVFIFYAFIIHRNGLPFANSNFQLFQFARFENASGDEDGILAIVNSNSEVSEVQGDSDDESPSKAFDNPMYGAARTPTETPGFECGSEQEHCDVTHANPVYSELKRREDMKEGVDTEDEVEEEDAIKNRAEEDGQFHEILIGKNEL